MRARVRGGGLTQRGSSWPRERVCGRGGPGKNHRDAKTADSKELWKSVERSKAPPFAKRERWATRNLNLRDLAATRPGQSMCHAAWYILRMVGSANRSLAIVIGAGASYDCIAHEPEANL